MNPFLDIFKYKLCYIGERGIAYFTSGDIDKVCADDSNDAPYELNYSGPYHWSSHSGVPEYALLQIPFNSNLKTPRDGTYNSAYSVDDINAKEVPWLTNENGIDIWAGITLEDFIKLIGD